MVRKGPLDCSRKEKGYVTDVIVNNTWMTHGPRLTNHSFHKTPGPSAVTGLRYRPTGSSQTLKRVVSSVGPFRVSLSRTPGPSVSLPTSPTPTADPDLVRASPTVRSDWLPTVVPRCFPTKPSPTTLIGVPTSTRRHPLPTTYPFLGSRVQIP